MRDSLYMSLSASLIENIVYHHSEAMKCHADPKSLSSWFLRKHIIQKSISYQNDTLSAISLTYQLKAREQKTSCLF